MSNNTGADRDHALDEHPADRQCLCNAGLAQRTLQGWSQLGAHGHIILRVTPGGYTAAVMVGYAKDKEHVQRRLRRTEGQVRGIEKMVEEDRYCIDVLTQVSAVTAALESVALLLLVDHTEHCVAEAILAGDGSARVKELSGAVERLVRG